LLLPEIEHRVSSLQSDTIQTELPQNFTFLASMIH
jgi:hypothetical protein